MLLPRAKFHPAEKPKTGKRLLFNDFHKHVSDLHALVACFHWCHRPPATRSPPPALRSAGPCSRTTAASDGLKTAEVCRQHGITEATLYRWKAKYGGIEVSEAKRLRQLAEENQKLKHVVAELTLDNRALKEVLSKNW